MKTQGWQKQEVGDLKKIIKHAVDILQKHFAMHIGQRNLLKGTSKPAS